MVGINGNPEALAILRDLYQSGDAETRGAVLEAYMIAGEVGRAIRHYQRSVELNPGNADGVRMLAELRRQIPLVN